MDQHTSIAIVSMSGLFPAANDLDTFWRNIENKVDAARDISPHRWCVDPKQMIAPHGTPDKAYATRCCLIEGFNFDSSGISLDEDLLACLDPLYHIVLHTGRELLSQQPLPPSTRKRTGVILAAIALPSETSSRVAEDIIGSAFENKVLSALTLEKPQQLRKEFTAAGGLGSRVTGLPAALLAKAFGLGGGTYTLDAACASSLFAVKLACDELIAGRADCMLAGGVSRPDCLYTQVGFSQLQALSPSGHCAPFDAKGDGLVVGEGAGMVLLKRHADAIRDGNPIYGLISGIGLSNDMRGNLLAPDSEGQVRAMQAAYQSAGWSPLDIDLIECHGAGTPVGDTTELLSLKQLWGEAGWSRHQCPLGSVKSNIGHLLTAAGAAGLIKILLALQHKTLPPSANFHAPPRGSPLEDGPFRVQTQTTDWQRRESGIPRRAAVSAFGFGGINAHLLLQEFEPADKTHKPFTAGWQLQTARHEHSPNGQPATAGVDARKQTHPPSASRFKAQQDIAVIGMAARIGTATSLQDFQRAVFNGESLIAERPAKRWKGADEVAAHYLQGKPLPGGYLSNLAIHIGEFRIPPTEIRDILPQHLLMLKVAADAMQDAGLPHRLQRPRSGVIIGLDFDMEATNFQLRWRLQNKIAKWSHHFSRSSGQVDTTDWLEALQTQLSPPLTSSRTLGALGGIVASRIAREFCFGGPSFTVSGEETAGLKALEIGVRLLQQETLDTVIVGAVDIFADIRKMIAEDRIRPFSGGRDIRSFDRDCRGFLPGEGAVAVVLKRADQAAADDHRVYALIKGIGKASTTDANEHSASNDSYFTSLARCFEEARFRPETVSFVETHGSGYAPEDDLESEGLQRIFHQTLNSCAVGALKPLTGHCGAASGLASFVKAGLCLYHEIIPPLISFTTPANRAWQSGVFHFPAFAQYWVRNRQEGARRAITAAMTSDGNSMHVALQGVEHSLDSRLSRRARHRISRERSSPLGIHGHDLFIVRGDDQKDLLTHLDTLRDKTVALTSEMPTYALASRWFASHPAKIPKPFSLALLARNAAELKHAILDAKKAVHTDTPQHLQADGGFCYTPGPSAKNAKLAFIFPGSGNHYLGMGRQIGTVWPQVLRDMDASTLELKTQLVPQITIPWRISWETGWQQSANSKLASDPLHMIFAQVMYGGMVSNLMHRFGLQPAAMIGYSLGESTGLFALGIWPDRGQMLARMQRTTLFTSDLAGPCHAARKVWNWPSAKTIDWCAAVVNRPAGQVREAISQQPFTYLLIVNTPDECVIGGHRPEIAAVIKNLACEAIFLEGIVTVHCDILEPVAEQYKDLHRFITTPRKDIHVYSCACGCSYRPDTESTADAILRQALYGFDFTKVIEQAYQDGIRIFLEIGPAASCTRMIKRILGSRPHVAVSASAQGENEVLSVMKALARLGAAGMPLDLSCLYDAGADAPEISEPKGEDAKTFISIDIGGELRTPAPPKPSIVSEPDRNDPADRQAEGIVHHQNARQPRSNMLDAIRANIRAVGATHNSYLDMAAELTRNYADTLAVKTRLMTYGRPEKRQEPPAVRDVKPRSEPAFDRTACLEFARGSVANVFGPQFAVVDTYKARVRLPDEPLMLVDRIITIEGQKGGLGAGRIVTEHDVRSDSWYLDGGRAPVFISVEAGQADLFLCAYLGIDLIVKGTRTYRLLDATVRFHRRLPCPGETIRYEIEIEKFIKQGNTYLFLFNFKGFIGETPLITMTDGCAGFFTEAEIYHSGGIIVNQEEHRSRTASGASEECCFVMPAVESYSETALQALRQGNLEACFGADFKGIQLIQSLRLPGGRLKLIERVNQLDPHGGRWGLGYIQTQAEVHPDDWYLRCHFVDDRVMPGTLMYECCAQGLRIFLQRIGWLTDNPDVTYEPVKDVPSTLKCRGPVTPLTAHVRYDVEIRDIGFKPTPTVIADAHMYADGKHIVWFKDMTMQMTGITREDIDNFWQRHGAWSSPRDRTPSVRFGRSHLKEFARGKPSKAFGERYKPFDEKRFIARLPDDPYLFIDRITRIEPEPWKVEPDGWIESQTDIQQNGWFFEADRSGSAPISVLSEIALQPCGWLAAYMGSALRSDQDLHFRNLGGEGVLSAEVLPLLQTLSTRARLTRVSEAADMLIEHYDFEVLCGKERIYVGKTYFGFFTESALSRQEGLRAPSQYGDPSLLQAGVKTRSLQLDDIAPLWPGEASADVTEIKPGLHMPARALRMIDRIDVYAPEAGPQGLGLIRGSKTVDPDEWFFKAHFYQDPVCPGSLGIESFIQLLKFVARDRWPEFEQTHRFALLTNHSHKWTYRGQILPVNKLIEVEALITQMHADPQPTLLADGHLKVDGLCIYQLQNFGIRLLKVKEDPVRR